MVGEGKERKGRHCPRSSWGSLQHSPDPLAGFKEHTSKGRARDRGGHVKGEEEKGMVGEGKEREGGLSSIPPIPHSDVTVYHGK